MAVLKPLRVIIDNYPEDQVEMMDARSTLNSRNWEIARYLSRELYIEQTDFMENPPKKYFGYPRERSPAKNAYIIKCENVVR